MSYTNGLDKPSDYFDTITYTGTGANNQQYYNLSSQADLIWCKQRSTANNHYIFDTVRGTTKRLASNLTNAEATHDSTFLNALDSTSITWGSSTNVNESGQTYVNWLWQAGGTAVSNTAGSITSSVSANTTAGFSIVSYTGNGTGGSTVGHGLSQKPACIIVKKRSGAMNWGVYHQSLATNEILQLDVTNAVYVNSGVFNATQPTSSVFYLGGGTGIDNASSDTYIAYCFAEKKGFSKFGKYTGNGSADGTFVFTGMKPAFVMVKRSDAPEYWNILDTARADVPNANPTDQALYANDSSAEYSETQGIDLVSNGFKVREGGAGWCNASGGTYIYMAFAENPFTTSTGIPTTAR